MNKDQINTNLFSLNPLPSWISDNETLEILDVNIAAIDHYGYSRKEFLSLTLKDLRPPEEVSNFIRANTDIKKRKGNIYLGIFTHQKKDGTRIQMEINGHRVDINDRQCLLVVCQDVTEKIKQEEKILQSEQRFKALVQEGSDLIGILDQEGNYLYVSPTSTSVLGIPPEDFIGRSPFEFIHPDDAENVLSSLHKIATEKKVLINPFRFQNHKKEYRWVETVLTNMMDNPAVNGIVANSRDITDKVNAQKELESNELFNRTVLESSPDCLKVLDVEGRLQFMNFNGRCQMEIDDFSDYKDKNWWILWGPENEDLVKEAIDKALKGENAQFTAFCPTAKGTPKWWDVMVSPVGKIGEGVKQIISVSRDITQLKQKELEKELVGKISLNFSFENDLLSASTALCNTICDYGFFDFVELWLPNIENTVMQLFANKSATSQAETFYECTEGIKSFALGKGLSGSVWNKEITLFWDDISKNGGFERKEGAKKAGIESAMGIPLIYNDKVVGVLVVGTQREQSYLKRYKNLFEHFQQFIGSEISRKKLEKDLQHLYNAIPDIICITDLQGRYLKINKAGCDLIGQTEEEILYNTFEKFVHPNDKASSQNDLKKLINGEKTYGFENRYINKNGEIIWLSWTSNSNLQEGLIYATARNITEEKRLRELNRQMSKLAKIGSWEIDVVGNKVYWSDMVHKLHGTNPSSFEPDVKAGINFYREDFRELVRQNVEKCVSSGIPFDFEAVLVTAKNSERWVRAIGHAEMVNGKCERIFGSFQDIDKLKKSEIELAASENKFRTILEAEPECIKLLGPDGEVLMMNPAGLAMIEADNEEQILGTSVFGIIVPEHQPAFSELNKRVFSGESGELVFEIVGFKGTRRWMETHAVPLRNVQGDIISLLGVTRDITESKKSEEAIRDSEEKRRLIMSGALDAIICIDTNENITFWNPQAEVIFGWTESEAMGQIMSELIVPIPLRKYHNEGIKRYLETGEGKAINRLLELTAIKRSGAEFPIELIVMPVKQGNEVFFCAFIRDITQRKKAEAELRHAFEEKNNILESIGDAFFALNKDWIVTYWNKEAEKILGKKREEILGENLWEKYADAIDSDFYRQYHKAMDTGEIVDFEEFYPTIDKWFEVSAYPNEDGLSVYFKDVTLRKKADIRLVQANERFEKVTDATNDAIWDFDVQNNHLFWGRGFDTLFGYSMDSITPSFDLLISLIHEDDRERVINKVSQFMQDSKLKNWYEEYQFLKADGSYTFVIDRAIFLRNNKGDVTRVIGAMTDISERKHHEQQLVELNESLQSYAKELERSNEELESFAFITSHDLQEPLRMISSFMDLLKRKYGDELDEKALQYIHFASDGAKRMRHIILDLLEYSRAGQPIESMEEVDLNDMLSDFKQLRRKVISEKNVTLSNSELPTIFSSKAAITQVFHSLLDNAIKYSKEGITPHIKIHAAENKDEWKFTIKDNGIGIAPEFFDKIFIIFQRLHSQNDYDGTGIGLSIAKKHVEFLGGEIWLESTVGVGTTFYFTVARQKIKAK